NYFVKVGDSFFKPTVNEGVLATLNAEELGTVVRETLGFDLDPAHDTSLLERLTRAVPRSESNQVRASLSEEAMKAWLRCRFPRYQVDQMLQGFPMHTAVVDHMLGTELRADGLERFKHMTKDDVRRAVERSIPALVDGIYGKIEAFQKVVAGEKGISNLKFAGDLGVGKTFEGKFESGDVFDKGLDKYIGLPSPKVLEAVINEHKNAANSDVPFETSNTKLTCTSKEEFEAVFNPRPNKQYPGAGNVGSYSAVNNGQREIVPLRVYLHASGCVKSGQEDIQRVLQKMQKLGVSLELTEEDRVREAMVVLMMAHPGLSKIIKKLQKHLDAEKNRGEKIDMDLFFNAMEMESIKGWPRTTTQKFIDRGRVMFAIADLRPEEVLCIRLYTGGMFVLYNAVLRRFPENILDSMKGNKYVTTIHCINSAVIKLSRVSPLTPRSVWRGSKNMKLPLELAGRDHLGRQGIVEMGFLSLTTNRDMAIEYAAGDALSTVLHVTRGDRSSGALIAPFSEYIEEEEVLIPPLCYLERTGNPRMAFTAHGGGVNEVTLQITVNQHADTIDGLVERRKFLHLGMLENLNLEVEMELKSLDLIVQKISGFDKGSDASGLQGTENGLGSFCELARKTCADVLERHKCTPPV
ncbi:MAG: ADP-ribosyltransferase domain-containing protein, partial [Promethearchaeia archaeon]